MGSPMLANRTLSRLAITLIVVQFACPGQAWAQALQEASRVRILLVLDTDDRMGSTWGLDGENMKEMLEATLKRQKLEGRFTIDVFTGSQVTPANILRHFSTLKTDKTEALVFYYSGHGGFNAVRGHFLALHWGMLYRNELVAAMKKKEPRLIVLLTDCCANITGQTALAKEPRGAIERATESRQSPQDPARREEPASVTVRQEQRQPQPRPTRPKAARKAKVEEPPFSENALRGRLGRAQQRAPHEEPKVGSGKGTQLLTAAGVVPLRLILDKADGVIMRDLLFKNQGVCDINGCKKGTLSHGTREWGGSLFTNALLALQKEPAAKFDKNRNNLIEWDEFFPHLQQGTKTAGQKVGPGGLMQVPEMFQFTSSVGLPASPERDRK